jgi:hypothetical protein
MGKPVDPRFSTSSSDPFIFCSPTNRPPLSPSTFRFGYLHTSESGLLLPYSALDVIASYHSAYSESTFPVHLPQTADSPDAQRSRVRHETRWVGTQAPIHEKTHKAKGTSGEERVRIAQGPDPTAVVPRRAGLTDPKGGILTRRLWSWLDTLTLSSSKSYLKPGADDCVRDPFFASALSVRLELSTDSREARAKISATVT